MVSQELLEELKTIIREDCGVGLQQNEIAEIGNTLVGYFELLAKIDREEPIEVREETKHDIEP